MLEPHTQEGESWTTLGPPHYELEDIRPISNTQACLSAAAYGPWGPTSASSL